MFADDNDWIKNTITYFDRKEDMWKVEKLSKRLVKVTEREEQQSAQTTTKIDEINNNDNTICTDQLNMSHESIAVFKMI